MVCPPARILWHGLCSTLSQTVLGLSTKRSNARRPERRDGDQSETSSLGETQHPTAGTGSATGEETSQRSDAVGEKEFSNETE